MKDNDKKEPIVNMRISCQSNDSRECNKEHRLQLRIPPAIYKALESIRDKYKYEDIPELHYQIILRFVAEEKGVEWLPLESDKKRGFGINIADGEK